MICSLLFLQHTELFATIRAMGKTKELLRHGFEDLNLSRVFCAYFEGNERSKKVQDKCGFKLHHVNHMTRVVMLGELRVEYVNVLTFDDWSKKFKANE